MSKKNIVEQELGIPPDYQLKAINSKNFIHANWHKNKLATIDHLLKLSIKTKVLDIGFGSGNFELYFANKVKSIVGIDYNSDAVEFVKKTLTRKNIRNVKVRTGDAKKIGTMQLGKFDLIIMVDVIEHFKYSEARKLIKVIHSMLNKNGVFCIITPNFKSPWVVIEWLLDRFKLAPELGGKQHLSKFDPQTIQQVLINSGFKITSINTFNTFSYLIPEENIRKAINNWELNNVKWGNLLFVSAKKVN